MTFFSLDPIKTSAVTQNLGKPESVFPGHGHSSMAPD